MKTSAFVFDVDGAVAGTEEWHPHAFNAAFAVAARLDWHLDSPLFAANIRNTTPPPSAGELTRLRCRKISASLLPDEGEAARKSWSDNVQVPKRSSLSPLRNTARCESETKG